MSSFYDEWLARSHEVEVEVANSPRLARGRDARWIETPQDARVAMLLGRHVGLPTQGGSLVKAEIPVGWHTGKHRHGEEAVHVLSGTGFVVIDGARYDWKMGTTIHIPYMAEHQFFNTGSEPAVYLSVATMDLDFDVKLGRLEQLEEKGANPQNLESLSPAQTSQFAPDGRRIALHLEDAVDSYARRAAKGLPPGGHGRVWILMGGKETADDDGTGFRARSVAITHIFEEIPRTSSHEHSHTEAMLYVLEGKGYSEVDGQRWDWEEGDVVHVPPKLTRHDHVNPNADVRTRSLRIECGIRFFYEALWTGYAKIQHRRHPKTLEQDDTDTSSQALGTAR